MEIMVNGQPLALAPGSTVADIAEARGLVGKGGVAIAVNGAVVRQADWPACRKGCFTHNQSVNSVEV